MKIVFLQKKNKKTTEKFVTIGNSCNFAGMFSFLKRNKKC